MNELLINSLIRQKDEKFQLVRLAEIDRPEPIRQLTAALSSPLIKIVLGPRRAGKSTLAVKALGSRPFAYANLEDEIVLSSLTENDALMTALDTIYPDATHFLLDEVQNLDSWEIFLNRQHRRGRNLVVTGSNSKLLSRELATSLTGRHSVTELLPFSFSEFITAKSQSKRFADEDYQQLFDQWLRSGGFPDVVLGRVDENTYLRTLFDSILLRDVVGRHNLRNVAAIRSISQLLINSITSRFTSRSLERSLKQISFNTIQKYLNYFTEAYLFFELQSFSFKTRKRISSDRKIFTIDNGFISANAKLLLGGESLLLENLVFVELVRRGLVPNLTLFYLQTKSGYEVDFFLPEAPGGGLLIQVSYALSTSLTLERELRGLLAAAKEFGAKRLKIITYRDEASFEKDGEVIEVIPAWKWILGEI